MFDVIWSNILKYEGEIFKQIRGKEFTYTISGKAIIPSTTNRIITMAQFKSAFEFVPLKNTKEIQHLQGPSYLYAILMDSRIRVDY